MYAETEIERDREREPERDIDRDRERGGGVGGGGGGGAMHRPNIVPIFSKPCNFLPEIEFLSLKLASKSQNTQCMHMGLH